jgi:hypothetical protein
MTGTNEAQAASAESWRLKLEDGRVYGPVPLDVMRAWAQDGRVLPGHQVCSDGRTWKPAHAFSELEMFWSVEMPDGSMYGPVNLGALAESVANGTLKPGARLRDLRTGLMTTVGAKHSAILDESGVSPDSAQESKPAADEAESSAVAELKAARARLDEIVSESASLRARLADQERAASGRMAGLEKDLKQAQDEAKKATESLRAAESRLRDREKSAQTEAEKSGSATRELSGRLDVAVKEAGALQARLADQERAASGRMAGLEKDLKQAQDEAKKVTESLRAAEFRLRDREKLAASAEEKSEAAVRDLSMRLESAEKKAVEAQKSADARISELVAAESAFAKKLEETEKELASLLPRDSADDIDWIAGKRGVSTGGKSGRGKAVLERIRKDAEERNCQDGGPERTGGAPGCGASRRREGQIEA